MSLEPGTKRFYPVLASISIWLLLFGVLWILRSFFLLIFLTFVFAYLQARAVDALGTRIRSRRLRVSLVGLGLLGLLTGMGLFLFPEVKLQAEGFFAQSSSYVASVDSAILRLVEHYPFLSDLVPQPDPGFEDMGSAANEITRSPTFAIAQQFLGLGSDGDASIYQDLLSRVLKLSGKLAGFVSAFLLSILFSFLILLDLPHLKAAVNGLADTKIGWIYEEVSPAIHDFGKVLGKALEAQFIIAVINCLLTAIGIAALGLSGHIAFLTMIVFVFSFVPVIGVFVSSVPICLVALQTSGIHSMFLAIALIVLIHMLESYVFNPRVYGQRMRINPVVVLIILTVAGKLFHFWGLILGVPLATYVFQHAIRYRNQTKPPQGIPQEPAS